MTIPHPPLPRKAGLILGFIIGDQGLGEMCFLYNLLLILIMKTISFFLLLCLCLLHLGSTRAPTLPPRPGKDLAVFFAVQKYQNSQLTNLQNPVKNARDIAAALHSRFGFDTLVLVNPTQEQIIRQLNTLTQLYARNEDGKHPSDGQLVLFFSGHGMSEDENGYFLPADANPAEPWNKGIAYEIWRPKINKINCRHILVALDACYSARFDPDWKNRPDGQFKRPGEMTDSQRALANYETYQARVFYSSDNKENQTPDRSNFAKKLLEGLRSAQATDGFLTSKQLFANYVEGATPTPRAGTFGDDEPSSAFLFYDRNGPAKLEPLPPSANNEADDRAFAKAKSRNTVGSYQDYLDVFPNGRHRVEAEAKIKAPPERTVEKVPEKIKIPDVPDDGLVPVRGGTFTMGCTSEQQDCSDDEKPTHPVTLSDFYIGKYEVTQKLWKQVMGTNPSSFTNCNDCPVEQVSWEDVQTFLQKLSQQTGRQYRLPTEAEWEYAAREGGKSVLFGNGKNNADPSQINFDAGAAYKKAYSIVGAYRQKTVPVGSLNSPNALGLHDMSGNVWEWCSDWYGSYSSGAQTNPTGASSGSYRVIRGGSWSDYPLYCRVAFRLYFTPGYRSNYLGFRLARTL